MEHSTWVGLGDIDLFVRDLRPVATLESAGPPLVVIHGGPSWDHSYLMPGLLPISQDRHVVVFDLRGCGRSSRDLGPTAYQPEFIVEDVVRLLGVLGHDEVDLLGFSTGGQVAQLIVEAHPQLIRRLVLASTTAYADVEAHLEGWAEYQRRAGALQKMDGELSDLEVTTQWAFNGAPLAIWNLDRLDEYLDLLRQVEFSGDWLEPFRTGILHPWRPADPEAVLRSFARPTLILHGAQDMCFPVSLARQLHAAVPNSELHVIDQVGHMAHFEQPQQWSSAVSEFLGS